MSHQCNNQHHASTLCNPYHHLPLLPCPLCLQAPAQFVMNLTWAAAKLGCRDPQLFSAIAAVVQGGQLQSLTPGQLSVLAWSFTRAKFQDRALGAAVTQRAAMLLQRQLQVRSNQALGRRQASCLAKGSLSQRHASETAGLLSSVEGAGKRECSDRANVVSV